MKHPGIFRKLIKSDSPHTHVDERGFVVKCYHNTRSLLATPQFWIGMTFGYPIEHAIWEHVWPFKLLTTLMESIH